MRVRPVAMGRRSWPRLKSRVAEFAEQRPAPVAEPITRSRRLGWPGAAWCRPPLYANARAAVDACPLARAVRDVELYGSASAKKYSNQLRNRACAVNGNRAVRIWVVPDAVAPRGREAGPMSKRTSKIGAVLAAGVMFLVAGCGSSTPTRSQYTASANAICRSASVRTVPLVKQLATAAAALSSSASQTGAREFAGALQELHATAAASLTKLRALKQPPADHAAIERLLTPFTTVTDALGDAASAITAGQPEKALTELERAAPAAQQITNAARAYGLAECATVLALSNTGRPQPIHAVLSGENHNPIVNRPWAYTIRVTDAQGNKLSGTETTQYTYSGTVVGTERPTNVKFTAGFYHDTVEFPPPAVGMPLDVHAVVHTSLGSVTLDWPIVVKN